MCGHARYLSALSAKSRRGHAHTSSPRHFVLSHTFSFSRTLTLSHTRSSCAHKVVDFRGFKSLSCKRIFHKINRSTPRGDQFARQEKTPHNTQEVAVKHQKFKHQNCFLLAILFRLRLSAQRLILPPKPPSSTPRRSLSFSYSMVLRTSTGKNFSHMLLHYMLCHI